MSTADPPGADALTADARQLPPGLPRALVHVALALARVGGLLAAALAALTAGFALLGHPVIAHGVAILLLALIAAGVHELGHVVAYRLIAPGGRAAFRPAGWTVALVRERLPPAADRLVTAAGPCAPVLLVVAAAPLAPVFPAEAVAAAVVAVAHLSSLVLPTADRRAWREARSAHPSRPTLGA